MNVHTRERLEGIRNTYFGSIKDPAEAHRIEIMYMAFAARLMLDTEISASSNQGDIHGDLVPRKW